ncbi:hypothetical protein GW17_00014722 [Ensete ventricosum]|nr:hypothetical protein GW17_00014722 [Ensete ventricosum]RZR99663.1 hypothetical protein BHM03_00029251 [Ensete ventricosum]
MDSIDTSGSHKEAYVSTEARRNATTKRRAVRGKDDDFMAEAHLRNRSQHTEASQRVLLVVRSERWRRRWLA